ncbi:MAG: hypothetical protein IH859_07750, partial [Chloroflexi bacterium]|nr:hypothetical protein [Chloroflexota bacterium]
TIEWTIPYPIPHDNFHGNLPVVHHGAYEYSDEDLANWDQGGAGMTFRKYYQEYEEVARKFGLDPAKQPTKKDIAETRKLLGYEPRYSLKNLLDELTQYGEEGPPKP